MASATELALQKAKQEQLNAQEMALLEARKLAEQQKGTVVQQAEGLAQEAFVGKKQQERTLPNVMARAGLAGQGYTETTANAINTSYQKAWNEIMKSKATSLSGVDTNLSGRETAIGQAKAGIEGNYQTNLSDYYRQQEQNENARKAQEEQRAYEQQQYERQLVAQKEAEDRQWQRELESSKQSYNRELSLIYARNKATTDETKNPVTGKVVSGNAEAQAIESLRNFTFDPYNPVASKTKMYEYLAPFLTDKKYKLSASQIEKIIDQYIAQYAKKPNTPYKDSVSRTKPLYDL